LGVRFLTSGAHRYAVAGHLLCDPEAMPRLTLDRLAARSGGKFFPIF
jgi:hypothetical protein